MCAYNPVIFLVIRGGLPLRTPDEERKAGIGRLCCQSFGCKSGLPKGACDQFVPRSCPLTSLSSSTHLRLYFRWVYVSGGGGGGGGGDEEGASVFRLPQKKKIEKKNFKSGKLKKSGQVLWVCYLILKIIAKNHCNIIEKEPF